MSPRTYAVAAFLAALVGASPGFTQVVAPPADAQSCTINGVACGVSPSDIQTAITAATPPDCGVPAADTLNGTVGVSARCMPKADATRPTAVQAGNVTTDANAGWAITFAKAFSGNTPYVHAEPLTPSANLPVTCSVYTRTATSATGKCFQSGATTLASTPTAIVGTVISPFANAAAGIVIMVIARESTQ